MIWHNFMIYINSLSRFACVSKVKHTLVVQPEASIFRDLETIHTIHELIINKVFQRTIENAHINDIYGLIDNNRHIIRPLISLVSNHSLYLNHTSPTYYSMQLVYIQLIKLCVQFLSHIIVAYQIGPHYITQIYYNSRFWFSTACLFRKNKFFDAVISYH